MLLSSLFGNETAEKVLLFLENYGTGYARKIALTFDLPISQIQRQLERMERGAILTSRLVGKTREYQVNPRYLFREQLSQLLREALNHLPQETTARYFKQRTRPRRKGKPL